MSRAGFDALILAPMAGVTDGVFRLLCHEQGARLCYTEMVSAKGYVYSGGENRQTRALLEVMPGAGPTALQLFGKDPVFFAEAIPRILADHPGFVGVDLNMGCPAPKIAGSGEGAALMRTPGLAAQIIRAAVQASPVPVSVKMRLGWDEGEKNALSFAQMAQDAGASRVCVHGRTRMQFYAGQADWAAIGEIKARLSIPVYGSGDMVSAQQVLSFCAQTGCDGAMVARGAMGNPWIFRDIAAALQGCSAPPVSAQERINMALHHARLQIAQAGEALGILEMRKHVAWYLKGLKGAAGVRVAVNRLETYGALEACLRDYASALSWGSDRMV